MASTMASFIQTFPPRGGCGGGGGVISGGAFTGMIGGGGAWFGSLETSFSIVASSLSHWAGASKWDSACAKPRGECSGLPEPKRYHKSSNEPLPQV
jgi:hypothetical protein